mmetsp:Transcript_83449/g.150544  ORF Transcript_83449/g.150544 Transcript_83449/m.150544 type:complete len:250 (-) Transcript_83449:35-784(-)
MDANCRVSQDCLGTCCRNRDVLCLWLAIGACHHVLEVVQMSGYFRVFNLQVAHSRLKHWAPVYHALAAKDDAHLVHPAEGLYDRRAHLLVQRKLLPGPVGRGPQSSKLVHNGATLLALPLPNAPQKLVAANLLARSSLGDQLPLHQHLRGNSCMIRAWEPQGAVATHSMEASQNILQARKHGMTHVQPASHIGRRHRQHIRAALASAATGSGYLFCNLRLEEARSFPPAVQVLLNSRGLVPSRHCPTYH